MATSFPGLYRAKIVKIDGIQLTVQIPQVYGEATVTISEVVGTTPTTVGMGYVSFRSGDPAFPVWFSTEPAPVYFTSDNEYRFNATITAPPTNSQIRINNVDQKLATTMWIHQSTLNGLDVHGLLLAIHAGVILYLQDEVDLTIWQTYNVTGPAVYTVSYVTIPVVWKKGGTALSARDVMLLIVAPIGERIL